MPRARLGLRTVTTTFVVGLALVATVLISPQATAGDAVVAPVSERTARANLALANAQAALRGQGGDATIALRDLWALSDALAPAQRAQAKQLAARPTGTNATLDSGNIRIHYNSAAVDVPFTAQQVLDEAVYVGNTYIAAGYRKPKPDCGTPSTASCAIRGGTDQTDIYVVDLSPGLYGYCSLDDNTEQPGPGRFDVPAFCAVDKDYAGFPTNTPLENLQVTLAHEYFHAVQFGYDVLDDGWFLEATATWAEDEVYDDVNDNVQYLRYGSIGKPKNPMTKFGGLAHYGQWIFFRYLTEKFGKKQGPLPKLILDIWEAADSSKGAKKNLYSTQAISKVLAKQKFPVDKAVAYFTDANRRARQVYDEGQANNYPEKKLAGSTALAGRGKAKRFSAKLGPWASSTFRYQPKNLGKGMKLLVSVSGPAKANGTRAVVTIWKKGGKASQKFLSINKKGKGSVKMAFDSANVEAVEVTLVNASARYKQCFTDGAGTWPCYGKPVDKKINLSVLGVVVR